MFKIYNTLNYAGLRTVSWHGMKPAQVLQAVNRLQRGGTQKVCNLVVRTRVPALVFHRIDFNPKPYYVIASDSPLSFMEFINFLETLGDKFLKAWMISRNENGEIERDVSLSNFGVSINGELTLVNDFKQSIDYVAGRVPPEIKSQPHYLGKTVGAYILGKPQEHSLGIEARPESAYTQFSSLKNERDNSINGTIKLSAFNGLLNKLLEDSNLLSLEYFQPALSEVVRYASVSHDLRNNVYNFDVDLVETSPEILMNLQQSIF